MKNNNKMCYEYGSNVPGYTITAPLPVSYYIILRVAGLRTSLHSQPRYFLSYFVYKA